METLVAIALSFVLTGLIGNRLLQQWQQRNWLQQQQLLGREKEYFALRELCEELAQTMGARHFQMRRLLASVRTFPLEKMEGRLLDYEKSLIRWNESINSYNVRLTFYTSYGFAKDLEESVQKEFVRLGSQIEALVRRRRMDAPVSREEVEPIRVELDNLQARIFRFSRDLVSELEKVRSHTYFGRRIHYRWGDLKDFSTWDLIKALFIRDVYSHSIIRPSDDIAPP